MERLSYALADGLTIARRNVIRIRRVPELAVGALLQPLLMILMFAYVFGGSIAVPGGSYREFLIGGIFALILTFNSSITGAGLAQDMQAGIINRFRILPMSRSAVVLGRIVSDLLLNSLSLVVVAVTGLVVGWRIHDGVTDAALAFGLLLLFSFALSWIMAYIGLVVPSVEVVNNASLMVIFPITFIANTLVPSDNLPTVLRTIAEWNPVSTISHAARDLFGNMPNSAPEPSAWPLQHAELYTLGWIVAIIAVFAPLAIRRYRSAQLSS
jgi:ABC-2 type transport system permease protein